MTITIPHVDYKKHEHYADIIESLMTVRDKCRDNTIQESIQESIVKCNEILRGLYKIEDDYLNLWKSALKKHYKATLHRKTDYGEYNKTWYIFPYDVIDINETIWFQLIDPSDDYKGGVIDCNKNAEELWFYDITLEEVSREDFGNQAVISADRVIQRRERRLKEDDERNTTYNFVLPGEA